MNTEMQMTEAEFDKLVNDLSISQNTLTLEACTQRNIEESYTAIQHACTLNHLAATLHMIVDSINEHGMPAEFFDRFENIITETFENARKDIKGVKDESTNSN